LHTRYDTKADIFSFGVLLWVLISQKEPYTAFSHSWDVAKFVIDGNREAIPAGCPYDYATLLRQCWDQDPENRPSIQEVLEALTEMYNRGLENETKQ
jgi:serine/threonine protein kinase